MKMISILLIISIIIPSIEFNIIENKSTIRWKGSKSTGSYHDGNILIVSPTCLNQVHHG